MNKNIEYFSPTVKDVANMQLLVKKEIESGTILDRTPDEMSTTIRSYTCVKIDGLLVGFVALHIYSTKLAEVRSLIVKENYRGMNIGKQLVEHCIAEAKKLEINEILALTYNRIFFEKLGFKEINKELLPDHKIWADCIKCIHFPVCNETALTLSIQ